MTWLQDRDHGFTGTIAKGFGVPQIPHTFTIDADGVLQDEHIGRASIEGKLNKLVSRARELQTMAKPTQSDECQSVSKPSSAGKGACSFRVFGLGPPALGTATEERPLPPHFAIQHFLNFFPLAQGQGEFRRGASPKKGIPLVHHSFHTCYSTPKLRSVCSSDSESIVSRRPWDFTSSSSSKAAKRRSFAAAYCSASFNRRPWDLLQTSHVL
jgi:hypothetical protein